MKEELGKRSNRATQPPRYARRCTLSAFLTAHSVGLAGGRGGRCAACLPSLVAASAVPLLCSGWLGLPRPSTRTATGKLADGAESHSSSSSSSSRSNSSRRYSSRDSRRRASRARPARPQRRQPSHTSTLLQHDKHITNKTKTIVRRRTSYRIEFVPFLRSLSSVFPFPYPFVSLPFLPSAIDTFLFRCATPDSHTSTIETGRNNYYIFILTTFHYDEPSETTTKERN